MRYTCCEEHRLRVVAAAGQLNGIEYLEVAPTDPADPLRQRTLLVRLLLPAAGLTAEHIRIDGGERIRTVDIEWAVPANAPPATEDPSLVADLDELDRVLVVRTAHTGDFSYYTAHFVTGATNAAPHPSFDPLLARVEFTFKVDCDRGFDCRDHCTCRHDPTEVPDLDYLAKDYAGLRRLLLDRLSLISPRWRERSPADVGMVLVELLAYEFDRLSYRQDAIATEPYLGTARSRISVRRHARLVDYRMHDGCSARVLLRCTPGSDAVMLPARTRVFSRVPGLRSRLTAEHEQVALAAGATVFETVEPAVLYTDHTTLEFYTWGDAECCLPTGSTSATLRGNYPNLKAGDVLVIAELRSPTTGAEVDADPTHRWPVRLTMVAPGKDPSGGRFRDPLDDTAVDVTEIAWDPADALPFPVRVSARPATGPVSAAWGNIVVADHGRSLPAEALGTVPRPHLFLPNHDHNASTAILPRFRPRLQFGPLTRSIAVAARVRATTEPDALVLADLAARYASPTVRHWLARYGVWFRLDSVVVRGGDGEWSVSDGETVARVRLDPEGRLSVLDRPAAASRVTAGTPALAGPALELTSTSPQGATAAWQARWDLLASPPDATDFTVETEHDGSVYLRWGDGQENSGHGRRPDVGTAFTAHYRIGNGVAGNVGAHTLQHIATTADVTVTNPLPAAGGREPETVDEVRRDAPAAYQVQERAVTPEDWEEVAGRDPQIQRAAATWRWTGSWHTIFITVDRAGGSDVDPTFERDQRARLERYRLAGYDLEVDQPRYVPLELGLHVCVEPDCPRSLVRDELLARLGALFAPDRLTFAQPVHLSPIYAAAQAVAGVTSVNVHTFRRQHAPTETGLDSGMLTMGRLEIARLDNNPNFPERGSIALTIGGGR